MQRTNLELIAQPITKLNCALKASKEYRIQLRSEHMLYFIGLNKKIKRLSSSNPKEYWKLLNNKSGKDKAKDGPNIEQFGDHFKSLNDGIPICDVREDQLKSSISSTDHNSILDSPITSDAILQCIKTLKKIIIKQWVMIKF